MNKQASCHDESDPDSLSFEQARERIEKNVTALKGKRCVTIREALGRVLADDVCSPMNVPPFINSAMDGYALAADDIADEGESITESHWKIICRTAI